MLYHLFQYNMQNLIYIVSEKIPKTQKVYLILIIAKHGLIFPYGLLTLHIEVYIVVCVCVCVCVCSVSVAHSCLTPCDPMDYSPPGSSVQEFSRQECWSGLPCPPLGNLPNLGIKPRYPTLQAVSLQSDPPGKPKNTEVVEWVAYPFSRGSS